jgi:nicotinamidase-related amidase
MSYTIDLIKLKDRNHTEIGVQVLRIKNNKGEVCMFKLTKENTLLVVIDIQEKLAPVMNQEALSKAKENVKRLINGFNILNLPVVATQQYTKGLGNTIPELKELIHSEAIEKLTFSCCGEPSFLEYISKENFKNIVITGMETHICVLQTAIDLLEKGLNVFVVKDAVVSREKMNWQVGIDYMRQAGSVITVTETVLFQLLGKSGTPEFKEISKLIK